MEPRSPALQADSLLTEPPGLKGFGMVKKAEIDVFLELSCFFNDPVDNFVLVLTRRSLQEMWGEGMRKGKRIVRLMNTSPHQNQGRSMVLLALSTRSFLGNQRS